MPPAPIEEKKKPAGIEQGGDRDPAAREPAEDAVPAGGVAYRLDEQREQQQHAGVGVAGTGELLLELGHVGAAAHDLQQVEPAALDRDQREQQDPGESGGTRATA